MTRLSRGFWTFNASCGGVTYSSAYAAMFDGCVQSFQKAYGPFFLENREVFTTVSIGIAISTPGESRPGDLLRDADVALYRAKAEGKSRWVIFSPEMSTGRTLTTHGRPEPAARADEPLGQALQAAEPPPAVPEQPPTEEPRAVDEPPVTLGLPDAPDEATLQVLLARISELERQAGRLEAEVFWERQRREAAERERGLPGGSDPTSGTNQ